MVDGANAAGAADAVDGSLGEGLGDGTSGDGTSGDGTSGDGATGDDAAAIDATGLDGADPDGDGLAGTDDTGDTGGTGDTVVGPDGTVTCATGCDDGNPCTDDACVANACTWKATTVACSDGNACTLGDACLKGICEPGKAVVCDDANPCTSDACDAGSGNCVALPNAATCSDGDDCTSGDVCVGGACAAKPSCACASAANCNDDNACTVDNCMAGTCAFVHVTAGTPCDDGNACTTEAGCKDGACQVGAPLVCDDKNPCTDDGCVPALGCTASFNAKPCNDADACTQVDTCKGGVCGGKSSCACKADAECTDKDACTTDSCTAGQCVHAATPGKACDDGNACTDGDACAAGGCLPGKAKVCSDNNPCTVDACEAKKGACLNTANAGPCDDGSACTGGDACAGGKCVPGSAVSCNDLNPCTTDACDAKTGCSHVNTATGSVCGAPGCDGPSPNGPFTHSGNSTCFSGICVPGAKSNCDDGNPCTTSTCDVAKGCQNVQNTAACDDGSACTKGDACKNGACLAGAPLTCDDGNACTVDACDPGKGCQVANASDGSVCIAAACSNGVYSKGSTCSGGTCTPAGGPKSCDDKNPCTDDTCTPTGGCAHGDNAATCDDGNACTSGDGCTSGVCSAGKAVLCDDKNVCTDEKCDMAKGCVPTNNTKACDDGSVCTPNDACAGGACVPGKAISCDDSNVCTDDACDPLKGCASVATTKACDDGNVCSTGDTCTAGKCAATGGKSCDDSNPCTVDTCDALGGCVNKASADGAACGAAGCTSAGFQGAATCKAGSCSKPAAIPCVDKNPCTSELCNPSQGCLYPNNTDPCDDGNGCTIGDKCLGGSCTGVASGCDDGKPCTTDSCDLKGVCSNVNNTAPCDDGDACTQKDACGGGICQPGLKAVCDDSNVCTADSCDKVKGCVYTPTTGPCNDANACTVNDKCGNGLCGGGPASCDDSNPCTTDTCDPAKGCGNAAQADKTVCGKGSCSGLVLQPDSVCMGGKCTVPAKTSCDDGVECSADACDATTGCASAPKAWGTTCKASDPELLDPFCAGLLCTGFEPRVDLVGTALTSSGITRGGLTGIDRVPGGGIYASGFDNGNGTTQGAVTGVSDAPLGLSAQGNDNVMNSRMNDVRGVLAVGGAEGKPAAFMGLDTATGKWTVAKGPTWNVTRGQNAVDKFSISGGETYVVAGGSDQSQTLWATIGRFDLVGGVWSPATRMLLTTHSGIGCGAQISAEISDVYVAQADAMWFSGTMWSGTQKTFVAFYDGNKQSKCGNLTGYTGEVYVNEPKFVQELQVNVNTGSNPEVGYLRGVHGTGTSHVMAAGTLGTVFFFDGTKWVQLNPKIPGNLAWSHNYNVRGVHLVGNEAWLTGDYFFTGSCRSGFAVHGAFDPVAKTWTWNKVFLPLTTYASCGNNQGYTGLARVWVDPSTNSVYFVGSQGTDSSGKPALNPSQQRQLVFRVKMK